MRIKILSRSEKQWTRDRTCDLHQRHRNLDPAQHPLAKDVEYQRALRGVKLERMFAKPFVCSLLGHMDSVSALATDPNQLSHIVSGSFDGAVTLWDIAQRREILKIPQAHRHTVKGIVSTSDSAAFLTCSTDKTIKLWDYDVSTLKLTDDAGKWVAISPTPICEYLSESPLTGIDYVSDRPQFVTSGKTMDLWDLSRSRPIRTYQWGIDGMLNVRCNKTEQDLVAVSASDRSITLYDLRTDRAAVKVIQTMNSASIAFNPMQPCMLAVANEDWNVYLYDIRYFKRAQGVFTSHTAAVMDVDFSPTGREFVTASYDRTLRIWEVDAQNSNRSRDIYHTKRMYKCWAVRWTLDTAYIISGSEDACVRVWKADAAAPIRPTHVSEKQKMEYFQALKQRHAHFPEIARIDRQRMIPTYIRTAHRIKKKVLSTKQRKLQRLKEVDPRRAKRMGEGIPMKEKSIVATRE